MPVASNTYDSNNRLTTTLPRREIKDPGAPVFDLKVKRTNPIAGAAGNAIRYGGAPAPVRAAAPAPERKVEPAHDTVDTFATPIGEGIQSAGMAYQPWSPGMPFSPLRPPVYTGAWSSNILNVKPEKAEMQPSQEDLATAKTGETAQQREDKRRQEISDYNNRIPPAYHG